MEERNVRNVYQELSQRYQIPLLDFSEMTFSSDTNYFMNSHHVNKKGANAFSTELAQSIDSLVFFNP